MGFEEIEKSLDKNYISYDHQNNIIENTFVNVIMQKGKEIIKPKHNLREQCFDYWWVVWINGVEVSRDYLFTICYEDMQDCRGCGGGGTGGEVDLIIYHPSVTVCVKNIVEQLKEKNYHYNVVPNILNNPGISHLSSGILDLFSSSTKFNLRFSISQLGIDNHGNEKNGSLNYLTNNEWELILDVDLTTQGTQLSIAKTIIHEAMHAIIGYNLVNNKTGDIVTDLSSLYNKYKSLGNNDGTAFNLTQHEFMSHYVDAFANSLAIWDNYKLPLDYYRKLSWGGLESSPSYQLLNNKEEIQNIIQNERYNRSGAKSFKCD